MGRASLMCTSAFHMQALEWKGCHGSGNIAMEMHQSIAKGVKNISQALGDQAWRVKP